jgi:DNA-binding CsgD family transcriptional regulator
MHSFEIVTLTEDIFFDFSLKGVINCIKKKSAGKNLKNIFHTKKNIKTYSNTILIIDGKHLSRGALLIRKILSENNTSLYVIADHKIINILRLTADKEGGTPVWIDKKITVENISLILTQCFHRNSEESEIIKFNYYESSVLKLYANGFSRDAISKVLGINSKALSRHKCNLMRKLGMRSIFGLLNFTSLEEIRALMSINSL